jgi:hypothetical protein
LNAILFGIFDRLKPPIWRWAQNSSALRKELTSAARQQFNPQSRDMIGCRAQILRRQRKGRSTRFLQYFTLALRVPEIETACSIIVQGE